MNKTLGIMGCGWLGLPLAKSFIQEGYSVYGTTTSKEKLEILKNEGIHAFQIALSETEIQGSITKFLNSCETLIVNVPPKLRDKSSKASYVRKMQVLLEHIKDSTLKQVVFVSSTSVYGDTQGRVTEEIMPVPTSQSGKQLIESEQLFKHQTKIDPTIVRFGGLIGPNRNPVTMLVEKKFLTDGTAPVNLIHLYDCIKILVAIVKENQWGETFNAVHPNHPEKQHYYGEKAKSEGLELPFYETSNHKTYKTIDSCKPFLAKMHTNFTPL